ncbi:DUF805 domain-containing protein [Siphonobacter aquaeclarae]|uniref:Uncharacterized membrane protein YhaH, DUF805 family n=1 Tax=Siphonobacter aquaeclarae TaxID=563176 RepID=A0A1G9Y8G6_9BACT|nr:DUF805 domain-containing protein [Siphonobacter aquaeclarae]SDN05307.1 Uncharacterized membrane protein YhaH, DUF805 family [Siphonobacter aquaeclarae]
MFKRPYSFEGRIHRKEYAISLILFYTAVFSLSIVAGVACYFMDIPVESSKGTIVIYTFLLPVFPFLWSQSCKRCHDVGSSGWYQLIPLYFLYLIFKDGEPGENGYGPDPKGRSYEGVEIF